MDEGTPKCIQIPTDQMIPEILLFNVFIYGPLFAYVTGYEPPYSQ